MNSNETAVLRTVLGALVRIQEAIEDGDTGFAHEIAEGAELDLAGFIEGAEA